MIENFTDQNTNGTKYKTGTAEEVESVDYSSYLPKKEKHLISEAFNWVKTRPFRYWINCSFGIGVLLAVYTAYNSINSDQKPVSIGSQFKSDMNLSVISPEILGGITRDTPPQEAIARLQDGTEQYQALLNSAVNASLKDLYSKEANRLYSEAVKEEQSGKYNTSSNAGIIDLKACPKELGQIRTCVLIRYASEGLVKYREGMEQGNLDKATQGFNRYISSLNAINPPALQEPNFTRSVEGSRKYLTSVYKLVMMIPPAQRPEVFASSLDSPVNKKMQVAQQSKKRNKPVTEAP